MRNSLFCFMVFALPLAAQAETLILSDLKAQNAAQLSADDLRQLMPGAKVVRYASTGSTHIWTNDPGGSFTASTNNAGQSHLRGRPSQAKGTWHVGDNGTYCVTLEWRTLSENWCRYIYKAGDNYYGVSSLADGTAKAHEFEFTK